MRPVSKRLMWVQIFLIFVIPVYLLYYEVVASNWRLFFLCLSALLIYGIVRHEKWSYRDLGLRSDNLIKSIIPYSIFTALSLIILFTIAYIFDIKYEKTTEIIIKHLILFLPISFFQEFAFRSFLIPRLEMLLNKKYQIIFVNTVLFTLIHLIYPDLAIMIPVSFIGGIAFAWIYMKYPNILLISIAHGIINLTAVLLGFFVL